MSHSIVIRGARQNNLKNLDLELPTNELIVVTGVSGSGKSSLVFDTIYAEGQRRYVETFSPYARQFLDRMDRPQVERIEGIPPAIAIDQTNPVRTSRSTVGTMTELNDHLKLLFSRAARSTAATAVRRCGAIRRRASTPVLGERLTAQGLRDSRLVITFPVPVPHNFSEHGSARAAGEAGLHAALFGAQRARTASGVVLEMIQDRVRFATADRDRVIEALEAALRIGRGRVAVHVLDDAERTARVWRFSSDLHCADCDIHYREPTPSLFSFNSPLGACDSCRGFGRIIGIDFGLIVPDEAKTLRGGAVRPWQTESYRECQDDLVRYARKRGIPLDTPWRDLSAEQRKWVLEGEGSWEDKLWYGVRRFFAWLETKVVQDAHPRAALEVSRVHAVHGLRRSATQDRCAAVATRNAAGCSGGADAKRRASRRAARAGLPKRSRACPASASTS